MNVKKSIKKVFAVGASAAIASLTLVGAFAYDLSDYPAPFVEDGMFNGALVVGSNAATDDVLGSIDIAASLQGAAVTPVSSGSSSATTTVSGESVALEDFNLGDDINDIEPSLDEDDMPTILAEETLDLDGDKTDYDQELSFNSNDTIGIATFGALGDEDYYMESGMDEQFPVTYLDYTTTDVGDENFTYVLTVDFDSAVDMGTLDKSASVDMAGTTFAIDPDMAADDTELVLFKGEDKVSIGIEEEAVVNGKTIKVIGADTDGDGSSIWLSVDGEAYQVSEGDSFEGFYANKVFSQTIPTEYASIELFTGSTEVKIDTDGDWNEIEVDGNYMDGYYAKVDSSDNTVDNINYIKFGVVPSDMEEGIEYLEAGEEFVDPLFETFKIGFAEVDYKEGREYAAITASSNDHYLEFTNENGDSYKLHIVDDEAVQEDLVVTGTYSALVKNNIFALEKGSSDIETVLYEVTSVKKSEEAENMTVELKNLMTGDSKEYQHNDRIDDFNAYVHSDDATEDVFQISDVITYTGSADAVSAVDVYYTASGASFDLSVLPEQIIFDETTMDNLDDANPADGTEFTFNLTLDGSDAEIEINATTVSPLGSVADDDVRYGLTNVIGTYMEYDEENKEKIELWIPEEEVDYAVYIAEIGSSVSTVAGAEEGYAVNNIEVGMAVKDVDVTLGSKPLIVVGGPYVNTIAAELMDNPTSEQIEAEFEEGKAMIKWYEAEQAMLVAGYSADDTRAACYVLADYNSYSEDLVGDQVEVITAEVTSGMQLN